MTIWRNPEQPLRLEPAGREVTVQASNERDERALLFNIAQNATTCAPVVEWMSEAKTRAVILGDISGSMGHMGGYSSIEMKALRKSFEEQAQMVVKKGGCFALVAWSAWIKWCPNHEWNQKSEQQEWLSTVCGMPLSRLCNSTRTPPTCG